MLLRSTTLHGGGGDDDHERERLAGVRPHLAGTRVRSFNPVLRIPTRKLSLESKFPAITSVMILIGGLHAFSQDGPTVSNQEIVFSQLVVYKNLMSL